MVTGGENGRWVRTRTEADAKAFLKEHQADQERSMSVGKGTVVLTVLVCLVVAAWWIYAAAS